MKSSLHTCVSGRGDSAQSSTHLRNSKNPPASIGALAGTSPQLAMGYRVSITYLPCVSTNTRRKTYNELLQKTVVSRGVSSRKPVLTSTDRRRALALRSETPFDSRNGSLNDVKNREFFKRGGRYRYRDVRLSAVNLNVAVVGQNRWLLAVELSKGGKISLRVG